MGYYTNLRVRLINFWKKNKKKILIGLIILLIVIIINNILKNRPETIQMRTISFKPHESIVNNQEVPEKEQKQIENIVDKYFNFCNNKQYEEAYNLITSDCRKAYYPTLESFKSYVDYVFEGKKKIYSLQSYSVVDNTYIYQIKILDDFMANGTSDGYYYYEEKLVLKEENGEMKLSIGEFVNQDNPNISVEDDYMKIEILERLVDYEKETYKIKVTNKTDDKYIVIADGTQSNEVKLNLGTRKDDPDKPVTITVRPGAFRVQEITFTNFYDNGKTSQGIYFGSVRILNSYDHSVGTTQENLDTAVKLYSIEIPF